MKPIQLQITGLNSFREKTTVDFERLLQDGLFGIFGPTGSGKSTILDAITLALYGKVRRAPGGMGGIINMAEQRCAVTLTFEIGHNGSRQRYTVDRLFGRNRAGGIETKKARISRYEDGIQTPISEKKGELEEKIGEILGITMEDFLHAVVLPQGEFAEFIGLKPADRSAMLQRLFGLRHYGDRLTAVLKGRQEELMRGRAEIEGRLAELRAYDDVALAAAEGNVDLLVSEQLQVDGAYEEAQRLYEEGARLAAQLAEYRELIGGEDDRRVVERELGGMRERIALADRCMVVRPAIDAHDVARERHAATSARYREAVAAGERSAVALAVARGELERASGDYPERFNAICGEIGRLEGLAEKRVALKGRGAELRELEGELAALLSGYDASVSAHAVAAESLQKIEEDLAAMEAESLRLVVSAGERELLRRLSVAAESLRGREHEHAARIAEAIAAEGRLASMTVALRTAREGELAADAGLAEIRERADALGAETRAIAGERDRLTEEGLTLVAILAEIEGAERSFGEDQRDLLAATQRRKDAEAQLVTARLHLEEAHSMEGIVRKERDTVRLLREETYRGEVITSLLPHLHDGEPCPLCGSHEHPVPHHPREESTRALAEIDGQLGRLETRCMAAEQRSRELEQGVAAAENSVATATLATEELATRVTIRRTELEKYFAALAEPAGSLAEVRDRVTRMRGRSAELKERLDAASAELAAMTARIDAGDAERRGLSEQRARLETELESGDREVHTLRDRAEGLRVALERERAEMTALAGVDSADDVDLRLEDLRRRDAAAEELAARIALRKEERTTAARIAEDAASALERHRKGKEDAEVRWRMLGTMLATKRAELTALAAEAVPGGVEPEDAEGVAAARAAERDRIQERYERARGAHAAAATAAEVAAERAEGGRSELLRDEETAARAAESCAVLLARHGFGGTDEVIAGELEPRQLDDLRAAAEKVVRELDDARRQLDALAGVIAGRDITDAELAALAAAAAGTRARREEAMLALGGAREKLRECRERNVEWRRMGAQESESAGALATMEQLGKYLRANGFVEYLANERLVDICRLASRQLDELTGGRLEIGARLKDGFYIRDYGSGGAERAPSSLSGGETFLVSLSLALALSDTIQLGRAPLEFFFLDEGFGTLDSDLLETVMGSLERLRSKNRAIGVISHVAQLREWIPRRLIVSPADDQHGSRLRYEVA